MILFGFKKFFFFNLHDFYTHWFRITRFYCNKNMQNSILERRIRPIFGMYIHNYCTHRK